MLAIYCRTSKNKKEGQDKSIPSQKSLGVKFANSKGWDYKIFIDEGISGTKDDIEERPSFADMLNQIRKGKFKAVYCIDQSRIERNTSVWNLFVGIMLTNNCEYYPNATFFDLNLPENILFAGMLSLTNQFYASLTSRKVKYANKLNAMEGKTHGMTAYGYKRGANGLFEIDKKQEEVVKRIYKLSLEGIGSYTIARILNQENTPTKYHSFDGNITKKDEFTGKDNVFKKDAVRWGGNVVYDMIANPIYKGIRKWKDEVIRIPAIIEEELWERVNNNLQNNKKNVGKKEEHRYLLNALIYCDECGSAFRGKKRPLTKDSSYKCKGKLQFDRICKHSRTLNIVKIETFVIHHLFKNKELEKHLLSLPQNQNVSNILKEKLEVKKGHLQKSTKDVSRLQKILSNDDIQDDDYFIGQYVTAKKKVEDLKVTIAKLEAEIFESENNYAQTRLKNAMDSYQINTSFDNTKKIVHSIIERINVKHVPHNKSGYYIVEIRYKGFEETSIFMTNWLLRKWEWVNYYRSKAIDEQQIQEDRELLAYLSGNSIPAEELDRFEGFETISRKHEVIELKSEDYINFV